MELKQQLLFLFSAFGAFNSLFLGLYFLFSSKKSQYSNYFLSALLLVISIRVLKSVLFYFNPDLTVVFIQIGLSACVLIGPFLFLYIKTILKGKKQLWWLHVIPVSIIVITLGILYPYSEHRFLWKRYIINVINIQWGIYIIITTFYIKGILKKLFLDTKNSKPIDVWIVTVFLGVLAIWLAYKFGTYVSYIVGASTFTFVFILIVLFWIFKKKHNPIFYEEQVKYADKRIEKDEAEIFNKKLEKLVLEKELYKNSNLKLADVAKELHVLPHYLSQFLNDNKGKSFSTYINEYRIEAAKKMLKTSTNYTTEHIGYECGFNSKSTFFTTFKKIVGNTPSTYKKQHFRGSDL